MAKLVIVNGVPGAGKSTLAEKLQKDLELPFLGKDMLKERMADAVASAPTKDMGVLLGKAATEMLYVFARNFLQSSQDVIIENAFWAEYAREDITKLLKQTNSTSLELYCLIEPEENMRRFNQRIADGQRHGIHPEGDGTFLLDVATQVKYQPLEIGECIKVDTTSFGSDEYDVLLSAVRDKLG